MFDFLFAVILGSLSGFIRHLWELPSAACLWLMRTMGTRSPSAAHNNKNVLQIPTLSNFNMRNFTCSSQSLDYVLRGNAHTSAFVCICKLRFTDQNMTTVQVFLAPEKDVVSVESFLFYTWLWAQLTTSQLLR